MPNLVLEWHDPRGVRNRVAVTRPLTIGRSPDNDIVLDSLQVSRRHCVVSPTPTGLMVDATMGRNGVVVGRQRMQSAQVATGGTVVVGGVAMRVGVDGDAGAPGQSSRGGSLFLLAGAGAALLVLVVVVGLVLVGSQRNSSPHDQLAPAVAARDPAAVVRAFGGDPTDSASIAVAQSFVDSLPDGAKLAEIRRQTRDEGPDMRVERVTYRLESAGSSSHDLIFDVVSRRSNGSWTTASMVLVPGESQ